MKILSIILNIFVGVFFVFSAYIKLFPIEYFEAKIASYGISGIFSSIIARSIIGFEFLLGLFLIAQFTFNQKIQKITALTLLFFIALNFFDYFMYGNNSNCGCMGMSISLSPLTSVLKNFLLLGFVFISYKFSIINLALTDKSLKYFFILLPFASVFVMRPVYIYDDPKMPMKGKKLDFSIMLNHKGLKGKTFEDDLMQGKKVVAFLSVTCVHCKVAGFKLSGYKTSHPELPIYFILNGDSTNFPKFFDAVGGANVEKAHFNGKDDYAKLSGYDLPAIFLLNNGVVETQFNAETLNKKAIVDWYTKK